ncbi:MAG: 50S ribosomal protein L4 [Verrucomicrobiales bacterium]|jgi:large subunit ribosomal protein L4|nr:50S ribosomal protein L4 [Verrucomicrobiales bacterium]MBP9222697.1 50S ribosomal protein L4 [Verrucomicrobiales bacterium]HQZ27076.1 50S ribosomal protein L4 [Verrucomicrobiales bacterium]
MAAKTLNLEGAKSASITLVEDAARGRQAVHDVIVAMHANRRSGTAHTKTRGEVAATGKKPFKQKGTGRARQGGNASPIHRGGGIVFGPRYRDYSKKVNRATKRLAFSKALTERILEESVLTVSDFAISDGKTKSFLKEVNGLAGNVKRVLIVSNEFSEETKRAARNCQTALLISAHELNTEQLLHYSKIVVVESALETLAARTAN